MVAPVLDPHILHGNALALPLSINLSTIAGDIWDYIAEDSVIQADDWVDRLDGKLRLLAIQPLMWVRGIFS
jgi:hypothetical protein